MLQAWRVKPPSETSVNSKSFKQAVDLAMGLSAAERAALAHDLLVSLGGPAEAAVAHEWDAEIVRRLEDLALGQVQTVDAEEALHRIDARLGRAT
jgi:putative addiction module component (TIGR02574 family)